MGAPDREGHAQVELNASAWILIDAPDAGQLGVLKAFESGIAHPSRSNAGGTVKGHQIDLLLDQSRAQDDTNIIGDAIGEHQRLIFVQSSNWSDAHRTVGL